MEVSSTEAVELERAVIAAAYLNAESIRCYPRYTGSIARILARLLAELLILGRDEPQVLAFGLEEEVNYFAPACRFPADGQAVCIPAREPSTTQRLPNLPPDLSHVLEYRDVQNQVQWVKNTLNQIRQLAIEALQASSRNAHTESGEQLEKHYR